MNFTVRTEHGNIIEAYNDESASIDSMNRRGLLDDQLCKSEEETDVSDGDEEDNNSVNRRTSHRSVNSLSE